MSNYGQQPNPYGQAQPGQAQPGQAQPGQAQPGQNPYAQPQQQPYGQPQQQPYGQPQQQPYGQPGQQQGQPRGGELSWGQPRPQQPYGQQQPGQPQFPSGQLQQGPQGQPGGWTPQPASVARPALQARAISVVTMDTVPGRDVAAVIGDVVGVVVRPRELAPELRAGNPLDGYATMLTRSRQDAVTKMIDMAVAAGADAVVAFKYDCSEITQSLSEVSAYGTAVKLAPEPEVLEAANASGRSEHATSDAAPADSAATTESDEDPIRDEASSATTLSRPASLATPSSQPRPDQRESDRDDTGSTDQPWPPSSWPSQN